jgi:hypothetical protein
MRRWMRDCVLELRSCLLDHSRRSTQLPAPARACMSMRACHRRASDKGEERRRRLRGALQKRDRISYEGNSDRGLHEKRIVHVV